MGLLKLNPGCVSSDSELHRLARSRRGLLHVPQKGRPGGSGRGVQQDKTPPVPGDGGGLGLSAFCHCQVSRTRIAYHLHRRKGCRHASNSQLVAHSLR